MTYREAIAEGRRLYAEAMDKAANYALFVSEEFDRPLATVCKEMADEGWHALEMRARRMRERAGQTADERSRAQRKETERIRAVHAKQALKDPEQAAKVLASLPDEALVELGFVVRQERTSRGFESEPRLATPAMGVPVQDLNLANDRIRRVIAYIQEGRLNPLDRQELAKVGPRIRVGIDVILAAVEDNAPISGDWDAALVEELA
jgi:hypothetical protein